MSSSVSMDPSRIRRVQWRLFVAAWVAFAFFHQGGGWNQNARFAMVRAVVERTVGGQRVVGTFYAVHVDEIRQALPALKSGQSR